MAASKIRIAVVSDIHAAIPTPDGMAASYASTAPNTSSSDRDAILSLEKLINDETLAADYLICAGDLADRANPTALNYIWAKLHSLAELLRAHLIATSGNHDIDSRFSESDFDARGILRNLKPPYPLGDHKLNNEYWSRNFTILRPPGLRVVVLNSCAYHGANPDPKAAEYLHGRISNFTLSDLRGALNEEPTDQRINILLCHHHPHRHQDIELADYSIMEGGEKLIDALRDAPMRPWLILHGHKHHPRLMHGAGGALAPLIFGAGSLSAKLHGDFTGRARNQFYIIEFDPDRASELDLEVAGQIFAWDYKLGQGWAPAKSESGLPARSGFGYSISQMRREAKKVADFLDGKDGVTDWKSVKSALPYLAYVLPEEIVSLAKELRTTHGIGVVFGDDGEPIQLARA
jgi:predicted phosphodiesterase